MIGTRTHYYFQTSHHRSSTAARDRRGFTLIETLVAIVVMVTAITATFAVVASALEGSASARDSVTSYFLAQGAFELIKNRRDTNGISGENWLTEIQKCTGNGCVADLIESDSPTTGSITFTSCSNANCDGRKRLYQSGSTNVYGHDSTLGEETQFTRFIRVNELTDHDSDGESDEIEVTVTVTSRLPNGVVDELVVEEHILNWR